MFSGWIFPSRKLVVEWFFGKLKVEGRERKSFPVVCWIFGKLFQTFLASRKINSKVGFKSKTEIFTDKAKGKFVISRQCQQSLEASIGREFFFLKSNHWDFHLIDIVFKINYVVYVHLTEDEDEEKGNSSLFRFFPRRILF